MKRLSVCFFILLVAVIAGLAVGPVWSHGDETHNAEQNKTATEAESSDRTAGDNHEHESEQPSGHHETESVSDGENNTDRSAAGESQAHDTSRPGLLERLLPGLTKTPDIHPMLVHFPIVFLWTSFLFVAGSWFWNPTFFLNMARWLFWLGLIALPVAAGTGFLAVGGWGGGHVTTHRNLMVITTLLAFVLFGVLRYVSDRRQLYRILMTVGLAVVLVFMTLGTDRGAWLVYVEGSGVKPAQHVHDH